MDSLTHKQRKLVFMLIALPITLIIGWLTAQIPEDIDSFEQSHVEIIAPVNAEK